MPGLYIHIPFCIRHCAYCHFVTTPTGSSEKHREFLRAIEAESEHAARTFQPGMFQTLYFGGGTPSALGYDETKSLFEILTKYFSWNKEAEITYEVNPGEVNGEKAVLYRGLGINRISLGVQSFHDHHLAKLGRIHKVKDVHDAYDLFRKTGFVNINIDLMLGLPQQTPDEVRKDVLKICDLSPAHVSLYDLSVDPGTLFYRRQRQGALDLPDEEERMAMAEIVEDELVKHGYEGYALACYAKPGFEARHNLNYWMNGEYLGLGPSAFSYMNGHRFERAGSYREYIEKMSKKDFSYVSDESLDGFVRESESFLLALRVKEGADKKQFADYIKEMRYDIDGLIALDLLCETAQRLYLTRQGRHVADRVFERLVYTGLPVAS